MKDNKVIKLELYIIPMNGTKFEEGELQNLISNALDTISISTIVTLGQIEERNIGEWSDDHPMNFDHKSRLDLSRAAFR